MLFIYLFICLFCPLLSEIPRNNQFEWIAAEAGKGEFVLVKHRQPKPVSSHTDTLPEESSAFEKTKQADTHQADRSLFPCPEDGCVKSYMTHGPLEQHLMYGKHEFRWAESLSLLDRAKISNAERLEAGGSHSKVTITGSEIHCGSPCLPEGCAGWESAKPRHRFNSKQKRYLDQGQPSGHLEGNEMPER